MRYLFSVSLLLLMAIPVPAVDAADGSLGVRASVPAVCSVTYQSPLEEADGTIRIEQVREYCNVSGYELYLEYPAGMLAGATVFIGGATTVLDGSGRNLIAASNVATNKVSTFTMQPGAPLEGGLSFALNMQPR